MRIARLGIAVLGFVSLIACIEYSACAQVTIPTPTPTPTPSPSASPTPVATSGCNLVYAVRIAQGGASCALGSGNRITVGCVLDVTATPLGVDLEPVPISVHGPDVAWIEEGRLTGGAAGQVVSVDNRGENPFNRAIRGYAPGEWVVRARNCGREGELRGAVS